MRIDADLVRRIEHSAAEHGVRLSAALAERSPSSRAAAERCDGGALTSFGAGRYVNRAVGLGLGGTPPDDIVVALREFYEARSMPPSLEVSPWADAEFVDALTRDGFGLDGFRNVYAHSLESVPAAADGVEIVEIAPGSTRRHHILAGGAAPGTAERQISDEFCDAAGFVDGAVDLVALVDGEPAACGSLTVIDGVGWLGGAATLPEHRGRGLQQALVEQRLRLAAAEGCDLAAATALPDGQSARNLVRFGFRLLYTQVVLTRR